MKLLKICLVLLLTMLLLGASASAVEATFESFCTDLKLESADVQAWLEIPGTNVSHPLMQHAQDDTFYLDHDCHGKPDNYGALFTESVYNDFDLNDPVVVIYGHRMNNGSMFGKLQKYYSGDLEKYQSVKLYMPDGTCREYTVFAAVLQNDTHILHYNNFYSKRIFDRYFDSVYSTRKLGIQLDPENRPEYGEQVLILSTCIKGDSTQRYLVMAKLNKETV